MKARNLYRELGLKPNADHAEVKRAYRALLKRYHPDLAGANKNGDRLERIIAAYRELCALHDRSRFDAARAGAGGGVGGGPRGGRRRQGSATGSARGGSGATMGVAGNAGSGARRSGADSGAWGGTRNSERERERGGYDLFTLGRMAVESNSVSRRAFAVRSLGNLRKKAAYAYVRRALSDPAELVVLEAARAVAKLRILQSGGELAAAFHAGSRAVKSAILSAVETIGRPQYFHSVILYGLRDSDSGIRRRCLQLFRQYTRIDAGRDYAGSGERV